MTLLNHLYWVAGAAIGGIFGSYVKFNTEGLDFVMTALFIVIFIEQWMKREKALQCSHGTWTFSSQSYPFWRKPIYYSCYARHFRGTDCSEKTIGES